MAQLVSLSGSNGTELADLLCDEIRARKPRAIAIASAYVSVFGVRRLLPVVRRIDDVDCRLIAGIDGEVTHPQALREAKDAGWKVRIGQSPAGIFHPKLIIMGGGFNSGGFVTNIGAAYIGSANCTRGGLKSNLEAVLIAKAPTIPAGCDAAFASMWSAGTSATSNLISAYTDRFSKAVRSRRPKDLETLGVIDQPIDEDVTPDGLKGKPRPKKGNRLIPKGAATLVWVGLQSFTGDYQFQIEFPKALGEAISDMLAKAGGGPNVTVECADRVRIMNFHYYEDNAMYRLNVPPDTPGADWARANHNGIAVVSKLEGVRLQSDCGY